MGGGTAPYGSLLTTRHWLRKSCVCKLSHDRVLVLNTYNLTK